MLRALSVQRAYTAFYSGDPDIISPPPAPPKDADDETRKRYETAMDEHRRILKLALDTMQWGEITKPGGRITAFKLRPLKVEEVGTLLGMLSTPGQEKFEVWLLAFGMALQDVTPLDAGAEVKFVDDRRWGRLATPSFLNDLGLQTVGADIVCEIGMLVFERAQDLHPKS